MVEIDIKKRLNGVNGDLTLKIDLKIEKCDFISVFGPSGSGKSTFLRILAGLEKSTGFIKVEGEVWQDKKSFKSPQDREIGFVFQDYALFPNMSVEENLLYVKNDKKLAKELLEMTEIYGLRDRFPHFLSGGQKQRVALCRAMMKRPKLLLLDEPFSALDMEMKETLQNEISELHKRFKTTTLLVSHSPSEIYRLSNRVVLLKYGQIIKDTTPREFFLKTSGSQKFSFEGKVLDLVKIDVVYMAVISIDKNIVEIVLSEMEAKELAVGDRVKISTKAFAPIVSKIRD